MSTNDANPALNPDDDIEVSLYESRKKIQTKSVTGTFANWRWALVWAAAPAVVVGWLFTQLPEWAELLFGVPAILLTYGWVIWKKGFGPEDRILFRHQARPEPG